MKLQALIEQVEDLLEAMDHSMRLRALKDDLEPRALAERLSPLLQADLALLQNEMQDAEKRVAEKLATHNDDLERFLFWRSRSQGAA
jgi:hypothetical protein